MNTKVNREDSARVLREKKKSAALKAPDVVDEIKNLHKTATLKEREEFEEPGGDDIIYFYRESGTVLAAEYDYDESQTLSSAMYDAWVKQAIWRHGWYPRGAKLYPVGLVGSAMKPLYNLRSTDYHPEEHRSDFALDHSHSFTEVILCGHTAIGSDAKHLAHLFEECDCPQPHFKIHSNATIHVILPYDKPLSFTAVEALDTLNRLSPMHDILLLRLELSHSMLRIAMGHVKVSDDARNREMQRFFDVMLETDKSGQLEANYIARTAGMKAAKEWSRHLTEGIVKRRVQSLADSTMSQPRRIIKLRAEDITWNGIELGAVSDVALDSYVLRAMELAEEIEVVEENQGRTTEMRKRVAAEQTEYLMSLGAGPSGTS